VRLWGNGAAQPMYFPRCKAKSRCRTVDAHFEDIVEMLPPPSLNRKVADSSIRTECNRTSYWIFHDVMPKIVDAPVTLIFRMWQRVSHMLVSQ
jgi:hypothetical protein